jgi:hypothetical protein
MLDGIAGDAPAMARYPGAVAFAAGYVDGLYRWSAAHWALFPNSVHVGIAVFSTTNDGHVLDCEPGNATPAQSVDWVLSRRAAGVDPTVYCGRNTWWAAIRAAFRARGVAEPHYWVADYSVDQSDPVIPPGAIALQYRDAGQYDLSVVADHWPGVDPPPEADMPLTPADADLVADHVLNRLLGKVGQPGTVSLGHIAAEAESDFASVLSALAGVSTKLAALGALPDAKALAASIVTALGPIVQQAVASGVQPDYGHMATALEAHLAATLAQGK